MKSKTCVCLVTKSDEEIDNKCDICGLPINIDELQYEPTMELRWLETESPFGLRKILQQKWVDNQDNFLWIDVPTVKEEKT